MADIINFREYQRKKEGFIMPDFDKKRMLEIEAEVEKLLTDVDLKKSPYVDIVSLVEKDGFKVQPEEMDIETTGYLLVNDMKRERIIGVNTIFKNPNDDTDVVFKKSRFITAHEYGHYKLHKEDGKPIYAHRDTYHKKEKFEKEADYFARSLLMPLKQFKLYHDLAMELGGEDEKFVMRVLSETFKVTKKKINERKEDLLSLNQ